jgi:hypothetical protein
MSRTDACARHADTACRQFVYEPHIAPAIDEFIAQREERRRQRAAPVGAVRDYTRAPRDEKAERARRAAAADAWQRLTESVSELDSLREKDGDGAASGSGVDAGANTVGLRRRAAGPMDEVRTRAPPDRRAIIAERMLPVH